MQYQYVCKTNLSVYFVSVFRAETLCYIPLKIHSKYSDYSVSLQYRVVATRDLSVCFCLIRRELSTE